MSYVDGQSPNGDGNVALNAANRVAGATTGNFAGLDEAGNLADSGHKHGDYALAAQGTKADNAVLFNTDQSGRTDTEKALARKNILAASEQELLEKTGYGVYSGLVVSPQGVPMTVAVSSGIGYLPNGTRVVSIGNLIVTASAADATYSRYDVVYLNADGTIGYQVGTASATPSIPAPPANTIVVGVVRMAANATAVTAANVKPWGVRRVGSNRVLLWETDDIETDSDEFTVYRDFTPFEAVGVIGIDYTNLNQINLMPETIVPMDYSYRRGIINGTREAAAAMVARAFTVNDTSIVFETSYRALDGGETGATSSSYAMPYRIYGHIKM